MNRNRRLSIVLIACMCTASLSGIPLTAAQFTDTDAGSTGSVHAGVLDVKLSEVGPATRASTTDESHRDSVQNTFEDLNHNSTTLRNTLRVDNTHSTLATERIGLAVSYIETDGKTTGKKGRTGNADATAQTLRVSQFRYKGSSLLGSTIRDENANGQYDLHDLTLGQTKTNLAALSGLAADGTGDLTIGISADRGFLGSRVRSGDGLDVTLEITGTSRSFIDSDTSSSNTIRYA